jgi:hypothetical protein
MIVSCTAGEFNRLDPWLDTTDCRAQCRIPVSGNRPFTMQARVALANLHELRPIPW